MRQGISAKNEYTKQLINEDKKMEKLYHCYCDKAYYDQWAVTKVDNTKFNSVIHVPTKEEAEYIRDKFNMNAELIEALKGLSDMYAAAFDRVDGALVMMGSHVDLFEARHAKAQEILLKATKEG